MREWERQRQADRRAVVQHARKLVDVVEHQLRAARLERRATERPLVYKTNENALIRPPGRLRYRVTDN